MILDLDHELARVDTLVQIHQTLLGHRQTALEDGLGLLELALVDPLRQLGAGLLVPVPLVKDDEALHADAHGDDLGHVLEAGAGAVVHADDAALDEAGVLLGSGEAHVENLSADCSMLVSVVMLE